jgi:DNA-binding transcriptional ArsR family regulator
VNKPVTVTATTFQSWRNHGIDVIAPTYVRTFFAVLNGATTVREIAAAVGMAETTTAGHLKRLRGWGLITWDAKRAGTIVPLYGLVRLDVVEYGDILACFPLDESEPEPVEVEHPRKVMDLCRGDMLTWEGREYLVKEVRKAKRRHDASVRLKDDTIERGEFWVHIDIDDPIEARHSHTTLPGATLHT